MNLFKKRPMAPLGPGLVGLYGKHPAAGDFLKHNAGGPEVTQLDRWLAASLDRAQKILGQGFEEAYQRLFTASFFFHYPQDERSQYGLLGVMAPSRDQIGRQFPLVIFSQVDPALALANLEGLPHAEFLDEATRVLQRRNTLTREALVQTVQRIHPPDEASLKRARGRADEYLHRTAWDGALSEMLRPQSPPPVGPALGTLEGVLRRVDGHAPLPRYGLRCPLGMQSEGNASFWLAFSRRKLRVMLLPDLLWSPDQLLLYLTPSSTKALTALLAPEWQDEGVCDLARANSGQPTTPLPASGQPLSQLLRT